MRPPRVGATCPQLPQRAQQQRLNAGGLDYLDAAAVVVTDDMISHGLRARGYGRVGGQNLRAAVGGTRMVTMMPPATFTNLPMCPTRRTLVNPSRTQQSIASPTKLESKDRPGAPFRWEMPRDEPAEGAGREHDPRHAP